METWLSTVGELHKKFTEWAFDINVSGWRSVLRIILYTIVDTMLWCITIWGSLMLVLVLLGKFASKTDEEIE